MTANSHIGVVGAGFLPVALGLPAAVAVDQLRQVGRLLGVSGDELVLQKFFGRWPLWTRSDRRTEQTACYSPMMSSLPHLESVVVEYKQARNKG